MQRPGWIGGDELHDHFLAFAFVAFAESRALLQDGLHYSLLSRCGHAHVDETRAC